MPKEWTMTIICLIHKKGDKTNCQNYRGLSLLSVIYKVVMNATLATKFNVHFVKYCIF